MEKINYNEIDFNKLLKVGETDKNILYATKDEFYKIYKEGYTKKSDESIERLDSFNKKSNVSYLCVPNKVIIEDGRVKGIVEDTLYDYVSLHKLAKEKDTKYMLDILKNVSIALEELHEDKDKIVIGDLHLKNILVNSQGKIKFVGVDKFGIDSIKPVDMPGCTYSHYMLNGYNNRDKNSNMDKISLYLTLFEQIFNRKMVLMNKMIYETKAKEISELEKLRNVYESLNDSININGEAPEVPYLHQLI